MKLQLKIALSLCIALCRVNDSLATAISDINFPILSADMGEGCDISLTDFYRGHFKSGMPDNATYWTDTPPVHSTISDSSINFECQKRQKIDDTANLYGASWNSAKRHWVPYYQSRSDKDLLSSVSKVYQLKSKNAYGFLRTTDEITGDENQRVRFYTFCLFHDISAVCGSGQSMRLVEPKRDYLPYILRVLRTVKFIDSQSGKESR